MLFFGLRIRKRIMKSLGKSKIVAAVGLAFLSLSLANCGRKAASSTAAKPATTICPAAGIYNNVPCTPGSSIFAGSPNPTSGYVTCPASGFYLNNGVNTQCMPGSTVYVGGGGMNMNTYYGGQNPCSY